MTWSYPLPEPYASQEVPVLDHPGAFGVRRKHHIHEGVDLYCHEGTPVYAVEDGIVRYSGAFTGAELGHTWWLRTFAVMIEGPSGLVVYGEIRPDPVIADGITRNIKRGDLIGTVVPVLPYDARKPERPRSMLHLELRRRGHTEPFDWQLGVSRPDWLLDPTPYLLEAQ